MDAHSIAQRSNLAPRVVGRAYPGGERLPTNALEQNTSEEPGIFENVTGEKTMKQKRGDAPGLRGAERKSVRTNRQCINEFGYLKNSFLH